MYLQHIDIKSQKLDKKISDKRLFYIESYILFLKQRENKAQMFDIIFKRIRKDHYIVNKSSTIFPIFFQYPIYKILYIQKKVRISYKNYIKIFHSLLIDKNETILIIRIDEQLKKEIGYIDHYNILLFSDRINDFLL